MVFSIDDLELVLQPDPVSDSITSFGRVFLTADRICEKHYAALATLTARSLLFPWTGATSSTI